MKSLLTTTKDKKIITYDQYGNMTYQFIDIRLFIDAPPNVRLPTSSSVTYHLVNPITNLVIANYTEKVKDTSLAILTT